MSPVYPTQNNKIWYKEWFPWFMIVFGGGFFSTVLVLGSITIFVYHTDRQDEVSVNYQKKIIENQGLIIKNHNFFIKDLDSIVDRQNKVMENHRKFFDSLEKIIKNETESSKKQQEISLYSEEILKSIDKNSFQNDLVIKRLDDLLKRIK